MKRVFADSFYFIALLNERDEGHERAQSISRECRSGIVTTRWVLAEVADALCNVEWRQRVGDFVAFVEAQPQFQVLGSSDTLFIRGLDLYRRRKDKDWSLTDCISFVVMADEELTEALTADRHFEQAGFTALLVAS
jgi:predicted nucleic acid-binding protein